MIRVLLVDEAKEACRESGNSLRNYKGLEVFCAVGAEQALKKIETFHPQFLLVAVPSEGKDLLKVVEDIHAQVPFMPPVLITPSDGVPMALEALNKATGSDQEMTESENNDCSRTLNAVLSSSQANLQCKRLVGYLFKDESRFCLENDPELIGPLVAHIQERIAKMNGVSETDRMQVGVALHEGLLNALFHGNLEVNSELREAGEAEYLALASERRQLEPWCARRIHVSSHWTSSELVVTIRDEGSGFDLCALADPTTQENLSKASGRGIFLMRSLLDELRYNSIGNEATLVKRFQITGDLR